VFVGGHHLAATGGGIPTSSAVLTLW